MPLIDVSQKIDLEPGEPFLNGKGKHLDAKDCCILALNVSRRANPENDNDTRIRCQSMLVRFQELKTTPYRINLDNPDLTLLEECCRSQFPINWVIHQLKTILNNVITEPKPSEEPKA